jgi:hypothetical protein
MTIGVELTFSVKRTPSGMTTVDQLNDFIQEHDSEKHRLIVVINPTGIGDAFADRLERFGFVVVRTNQEF